MANPVKEKVSKELQLKLRREVGLSDDACIATLESVLRNIAASDRFDFRIKELSKDSWSRHGERFDTSPVAGLFRSNGISLATEKAIAGKKKMKTKLKCKLHSLIPELLYENREDSYCYPSIEDEEVEPKFKLEQDIHFNNCKYCATGYFKLPGTNHCFQTASDFLQYYPGLADVPGFDEATTLIKVKDWEETVFDDMKLEIGGWTIKGALVTRRDMSTKKWVESEFSFKLTRRDEDDCKRLEPARGWDRGKLAELAKLYNELYGMSAVFIQTPSIFFFSDPVSSRDVRLSEE